MTDILEKAKITVIIEIDGKKHTHLFPSVLNFKREEDREVIIPPGGPGFAYPLGKLTMHYSFVPNQDADGVFCIASIEDIS